MHVITTPTRKERTCDERNRPRAFGCKHALQDSRHEGELHDATQCRDRERSANVEPERVRDGRVERNKGEADADV